jgi:flavin reductase (DIM6/NTAB) family NADH-FMN oxidoreductase RutF
MTELSPIKNFDPITFRNACGGFATGVTIITARDGEIEHGMTANAFMSISLEPPMIAVSIAKTAKMLGHIRASGRFAVSILPENTEALALHFAGRPSDSFREPLCDFDGLPVAKHASIIFATHVAHDYEAGDHIIFVGSVSAMHCDADRTPLLFHKGRFAKIHDEEASRRVEFEQVLWGVGHW